MPNQIIKDQQIVDNNWQIVEAGEQTSGNALVALEDYLNNKSSYDLAATGVLLKSDDDCLALGEHLADLPVIAIEFPVFTDGRGYTLAYTLKETLGFTGEIRAVGDVLLDQLHFLKRCGFTSFDLREDQPIEKALDYFATFSEPYQSSSDIKEPLFARR